MKPLLEWGFRAIGPRLHPLLIAQLLPVVLIAGTNQQLVAGMLPALAADADLRAGALVLIGLATFAARRLHRGALCPVELASLRRQPLGPASFALLVLPWALPLAWPWVLVLGLGHPDEPAAFATAAALGTLFVCGTASATRGRALAAWTLVPLGAALIVDRASDLAWPILVLACAFGPWAAGRSVREAFAETMPDPLASRRTGRPPRTPLGALPILDRHVLGAGPRWLGTALLPLLATGYVAVLRSNGNCTDACLDMAGMLVVTLAAGLPVAALGTLRRVQGRHFLVPDRTVPARVRVASLFLVALVRLLPFALAFAREPATLPHAAAVALAVLLRQLGDAPGGISLGPLLWLLAVPTAVALLPEPWRFPASAVLALALATQVDRRGRRVRAELDAVRRVASR